MIHELAVLSEGGFSVLDASLEQTLAGLCQRDVAEIMSAGFGMNDLVRFVATTPPFSEILAKRIDLRLHTLNK